MNPDIENTTWLIVVQRPELRDASLSVHISKITIINLKQFTIVIV